MQVAAFHRALDQILGAEEPSPRPKGRRARVRAEAPGDSAPAVDPAKQLIDGINRTAHPEVSGATKVLDRALVVLRIAARDFGIDGLAAPEIAKVLTEKFRQRTSRQAVTQALGAAHTMVDTGKRGRVAVYKIMQPGEAYLDAGGSQRAADENGQKTPTRRTGKKVLTRTNDAPEERDTHPSDRRAYVSTPRSQDGTWRTHR